MILTLAIILASIRTDATYEITEFGAVGDGTAMCTTAIQAAIDQAAQAGGGTVVVPSGIFLTGSVRLRSHVNLLLRKGATLLGSPVRKDYQKGEWYALILAKNLKNIAITGEGTIDGQGKALAQDVLRMVNTGEVKIPPKTWRPSAVDRPQIIEMVGCEDVRIEDVTIKNSACWVQTYRRCRRLKMRGIHVDSKTYWNNDGIDVVDCKDVRITDCDVDSDDDGICLKSEDPKLRCENVFILNCKVRSSASAIKFGTASQGGFKNVVVRLIHVRDTCRSCVALESVDGGILEDILIEHIKAVNTGNAFFIRLGHRNLKVPPGKIRRVTLRDFDVQIPAGQPDKGYPFEGPPFNEPHNLNPSSIVGHAQVPIRDVRLEQIHIRMEGGGSAKIATKTMAKVPERPWNYPEFTMFGELPAWALYVRHVRGLTIKDLTVSLDKPDYRPPFAADDVSGLVGRGIAVRSSAPVILVRGTARVKLDAHIRRRTDWTGKK